jgi:hypothetical protein
VPDDTSPAERPSLPPSREMVTAGGRIHLVGLSKTCAAALSLLIFRYLCGVRDWGVWR